ncbi:unnamed protein product [Paramecium octaurelia]|uniref:Uncharacterized protein n=1 Tax=Paramecium octaurelia TaxID=43137 RepID=A0A8S1SKK3_PAROT|nr:unnamed protein product [Paramecium octaurelia]
MYYAVDYPKFSVIFLIRFREFLVSYNRICLFEFQRKFIHPLHNNNKAYKIQEQVHPLQEPMSTPALPSDLTSISCTFINHSQADQKQKFGTVYANNIIGHLIQSKDTFTLGGSNSLGSQKFYKSYNSLGQNQRIQEQWDLNNGLKLSLRTLTSNKLPIPKKVEKTYAWLKIKKIVQSKMQMKYFISPKQLIADKQLI